MLSKDPRALEIEQLHRALGSRVRVEQAKGVLAERFGLTMQDSFELLRHAARSHRLKVHALADQIVETRTTPSAVAEAFDQANGPAATGAATALLTFVCECSDPGCHEPITLSAATLSRIQESGDFLVMKAGHELPFADHVVERLDGLVIVGQPVG